MDWGKIKIEYITDPSSSYRSLASKYGVSASQIYNRGKTDGWVQAREQYMSKIEAKTMDAICKKRSSDALKLHNASSAMLDKLQDAIAQVDSASLIGNAKLARGLTSALRDIRELLDVRSDADVQEQEARIDKLRREAAADDNDRNRQITIEIAGGDASWAR